MKKSEHSRIGGIGKIWPIFGIRKDERWLAMVSVMIFSFLNFMTVNMYWGRFSVLSNNYHRLFVRWFRISGFDPLTYEVISYWDTAYNVYRHPLLAFFMWPFAQLNQLLMTLTDKNFATVITAFIVVFCAVYSAIFLFRIFKDIIMVKVREAYLLTALTFSMAFIMLSAMVPDHFIMSMFALTLTLYLSGKKLRNGSALNMWQTIALFILTAGISLNNGLKIFLAALVTRRKRFFEWRFLLLAVVLPCAMIWGFARWEYRTYVWPKEMARNEVKAKKNREYTEKIRQQVCDSIGTQDSAAVEALTKKIKQQKAVEKYHRDHQKIWNKNTGKPIAKGEFMRWTDKTTSRWDVATECLFGEGIQLHKDYLLGDVLRNRPLIVRYDTSNIHGYVNYLAEAVVVLLFLIGVWMGRKSLFLWTAMSFLILDMALHMGLGFGINEIYIMSAHYLFVLPIGIAYLLKALEARKRSYMAVTATCALVAVWCFAWNIINIIGYCL